MKDRASEHYVDRLKSRAVRKWKAYLTRKYRAKEERVKADLFEQQKLCTRALAAWMVYYKIVLIKRQMKILARDFCIRHSCRELWNLWKERTVYRLEKHEMNLRAQTNCTENLLVKAFASLKNEARKHRLKRQNGRKAEYVANALLLKKCLRELLRLSQESIETNARTSTLGKVLCKVVGRFTRRAVISRLLQWADYSKYSKALEEKTNTMAKILIRQIGLSTIYRIQEHANKKTKELVEALKFLAHMKQEKTRCILKLWLKFTYRNNLLRHKLTDYTATHDNALLQSTLYEWKRMAAMLRCLKATGEEVRKTVDNRVLKEAWEQWKVEYIQSVENSERTFKSFQHHAETLIVKAFALLKFHCKTKLLKREKHLKAESFNSFLLMRRTLISLQNYAESQRVNSIRHFELTRKIAQIRDYNLKEAIFRSMYAWHIYRKRIHAGFKVLRHKHNSHAVKRFFATWIKAMRIRMGEKDLKDAINTRTAKQFFKSELTKKAFKAIAEFLLSHSRKLSRGKLHEVFTGWKVFARGQTMLRKYLKQLNLDEKYVSTPAASYRFDLPRLQSVPEGGSISPESALSSELCSVQSRRFDG